MHDDYISHYGVKRRSGRYPWGSGERPYQSDPQKAKLMRRYEREETKATQKRDAMISKGKNPEKIADQVWRSNNKLDDITRKLLRLEVGDVAREFGIYDKKLTNAAADYEWGKRMAKQYAEEGRHKTKMDTDSVNKSVTVGAIVGGPIMASLLVALSPGQGTLRGADYYEKVAQKAEAIWKKKAPNAPQGMLKMLEDKKG